MSLFYLFRFKFAVKLQIILFENAIIGHIQVTKWGKFGAVFGTRIGKSARPSIFSLASILRPASKHVVPVFSSEKALNIKKIIKIEGLGLGCSQPLKFIYLLTLQSYKKYNND